MEYSLSAVVNKSLAHFSNSAGNVKLAKLANVYMVTLEPKHGDNIVNSHEDEKKAQMDYAYFVHYLTKQ